MTRRSARYCRVMKYDTELFKQSRDNPVFKRWLVDTIFGITYGQSTV
ncbi:MAG TPA: hypothetical protein VG900_09700 [Hyphomicrobiaceae bacterium]|nr:hypothetical protein [Hyphomicrobiaceae bacterium]